MTIKIIVMIITTMVMIITTISLLWIERNYLLGGCRP
jgi:hypothetical protein